MKPLRDMLAGIPGAKVSGDADVQIQGIAYDSRQVRPGFLFVALAGCHSDGRRYIAEALARGAAAVASDAPVEAAPGTATLEVTDGRRFLAQVSRVFFDDPAPRMELVGITGTNGKTTTSYLLHSIFAAGRLKSCVVGTIGMRIGERPFPSAHTTPEAPDLLRFLDEALRAGCTHGSLEVSSHALVLKRVFGVKFRVGLFTNLTPEHLDFHGDMESYYQAKKLLFANAGANDISSAVINIDDPYGRRLVKETSSPVLSYGSSPDAEFRLLHGDTNHDGSLVRVATPGGELQMRARLVGRPNTYNILASSAAAVSLGLDLQTIREGIEQIRGVPGRLEQVSVGQDFSVFVDYAHTPDALDKLLQTAAEIPHARIITVFGCGGDRDRHKRPLMGRIAARSSDLVIATSDNPRSENPAAILAEIEAGLKEGPAEYEVIPDRRAAIGRAIGAAAPNDVVLIAGKGHEDYQIIGSSTLPFDDRVVAREWILQFENARKREA